MKKESKGIETEIEIERKFEKKYENENIEDHYYVSRELVDEIVPYLQAMNGEIGSFTMFTEFYRVIYDGRIHNSSSSNSLVTIRILEPGMVFYPYRTLDSRLKYPITTSIGRVEIKVPVKIDNSIETIEYKKYFEPNSLDYRIILQSAIEDINNNNGYKLPGNLKLPTNPREIATDITSRWVIHITHGKPEYKIVKGGYIIVPNRLVSIYSGERNIICKDNNNRLKFIDLEIEYNIERLDRRIINELGGISYSILRKIGFKESNRNMAKLTYDLCK